MLLLDLTLPTPAENVALDEALVQAADEAAVTDAEAADEEAAAEAAATDEILRIWEPTSPLVVVGRSTSISAEVNLAACEADGVPVFRRCSGGASIVAAPGCLMYALVLSYDRRPDLRLIDRAHRFVLETIAAALGPHVPGVRHAGTSDLALGDRKVSGNSMRCCRRHVLYHGTLLYDMQLDLVGRYLRQPPRQPDYRAGRGHKEFVANLPVECLVLRKSLAAAWEVSQPMRTCPDEIAQRLVREKYSTTAWNHRHP
jgi:lipoate-protein ligase A